MRFPQFLASIILSFLVVVPSHADVLNLTGTFSATRITGTGLTGLVSEGDEVFVEAFYDTDLATLRQVRPDETAYDFTEDGAWIRFTVNGLVWETTGPLTVGVREVSLQQTHPDGSVAASYGGPIWYGYTSPLQSPYGTTTIQTPFGQESGVGNFMLFSPLFPSELIQNGELPTNLSLDQIGGPFFGHGTAVGDAPNGDYAFDLTSPIPEPETYAMLLAGLGLLGYQGRRRASRK